MSNKPATELTLAAPLLAAASTPLEGTLSATGTAGPFTPVLCRPLVLTLSGTWAGEVKLLRSTDGGTTKRERTYGDGSPKPSWTSNMEAPVAEETVFGATYYVSFTRTSGTLEYKLEQ